MSGNMVAFTGDIPSAYDVGLGPIIFVGLAADLAQRVAAGAPVHVLETGAGTGILTRALRDALSQATLITATDLNADMLSVARTKFQASEAVAFESADATALPFPDGAFDTVTSQYAMMFYPDKDKGFRETHRVLIPGGRHVFSVADTGRYNTYLPIINDAVCRCFTSDPPTRMLAPLSYSQVDPIKDSLLAAGFTDIRLTVLTQHREVTDFANFARGFVFGTPILHDIRERATRPPEGIVGEVAAALRQTFGPEPTTIPIQALVFEARRE